jgi:uncharacterized membrane protein YhhN
MKLEPRYAFIAFFLIAVADIWFAQSGNAVLRYITKPMLMPVLMLGYWLSVPKPLSSFPKLILSGLFFSWLGDIFLMFEDPKGLFFIAGLLCFLTTHVLYIRYFATTKSESESFYRKRPVLFLAVVAYLIELLYVLWPHLGGMRLPVLVYGLIITVLLGSALWQYGKLEKGTAWLFILGALFFVASDSMLAVNKFKRSFPYSGLLIMGTYILAQYLIVQGSIRHVRDDEKSKQTLSSM